MIFASGDVTLKQQAKAFSCDRNTVGNSWARMFAIVLHLRSLFLLGFLGAAEAAKNVGAQLLAMFTSQSRKESRTSGGGCGTVLWWVESFMWDEVALPAKVRRHLYDVASGTEPPEHES